MTRKTTYPLIVDGHNDTLLALYDSDRGKGRSFFDSNEIGHLDLPRALEGGFGGGFFAIFVPVPKDRENKEVDSTPEPLMPYLLEEPQVKKEYAQKVTAGIMDLLFGLEEESNGQFKVIRTSAELETCLNDRIMAAILHFEGAEAIEPDLSNLEYYYDRGLRSLGLTWSRPNDFAHGVPFGFPHSPDQGPGLTSAGYELVRVCNQLGILIDLSHLNERGFWDVARLSKAPLIATHSAIHTLCPSTRNLTDEQLAAIADSDGLVGINFHKGFLREDGDFKAETSLTEIVRHINYVSKTIGIDHVALGSDFDGADMPEDLGDAAGLPRLMAVLAADGYDHKALKKIAHENWQRVLKNTWKE
ncbi:MAG: dipeptidase [Chloroflexota bacterium]|jgi:membrane dipeptidase